MSALFVFLLLLRVEFACAHEIQTNAVHMADAPDWLKRTRVEKIIDRIQTQLEWSIRRIEVTWYKDATTFQKAHGLGPMAMAVARKGDNTIHLGPLVNAQNFDQVFGHELVHIILGQKYKDAVPKWLEEGLANHLGKYGKVDYAWLARQPFPEDVRKLTHPYSGAASRVHYHYVASQALLEMIAKKCDLANLLRLSVGEGMESYLSTYCEIKDLNAEFRAWVKKKA
ncbi:MAG: hypothetical protein KF799_12815 [Bdellovibrionales bacterium]|nr:hypothetical protein [Bdellovibrionales bacterium]